jgi:hypothetical protein
VNYLAKTISKRLEKKEPGEEVTLGSFLRKYANALTMPVPEGQSSPDRQPRVQALVVREQRDQPIQDRKLKSPEKTVKDPSGPSGPSQQKLKKLNDVLLHSREGKHPAEPQHQNYWLWRQRWTTRTQKILLTIESSGA